MKVGLRLRTLDDGTVLVARIDPVTHDQLEHFREPLPHEIPFVEKHRPQGTPAPPEKVRERAEIKINVTVD